MFLIFKILKHITQRLVLYPLYGLSFLIPRKNAYWIFGSYHDNYSDNSKYLFRHVNEFCPQICAVWITGSQAVAQELRGRGYRAYRRWTPAGIYFSLIGKVYFVNSYVSDINYWTSGNVILFNLWHGIPLKKIEYDIKTGPLSKRYNSKWSFLYKLIYPNFFKKPTYLLSTAPLISNIFSRAFKIELKNCKEFGYPRTDHFEWKNEQILELLEQERGDMLDLVNKTSAFDKIFVYMPTWRDRGDSGAEKRIDFETLNNEMRSNNSLLLVKKHANTRGVTLENLSNIWYLPSNIDIYPILPFTDVLITDYSSIYFDYVLLGKPIIFYAFDKEEYIHNERGLYFDYESAAPGTIAESFDELLSAIKNIDFDNGEARRNVLNDYWAGNRAESSRRIVNFVSKDVLKCGLFS